ncbi:MULTISPECIES: UbiA family prenyltransferase [unclassified Nocardia]|uniref:UbiA family prenyltransferase n=1 Tax=unclassified Nocardia TaxID=2637762 RepID=UPI001CE4A54A|nr:MULTISPECIES: UbiA family prenyltransferase [unclassified Nocardia]
MRSFANTAPVATARTFIDTAVHRAGPSVAVRAAGILRSTRVWTRLWFDVLAPLAMFSVLFTHWVPLWKILVSGIVLGAIHLGSTLINDAMDVDIDSASSERSRYARVLVTGRGRAGDFIVCGALLSLLGIGLAFLLSEFVGALVAGAVAVATAYNVPPLRLSGRPIWPQLMWPTIWLLMFGIAGQVIETDKWSRAWLFAIFVALFMGVGEGITQDVRDLDNDAAGGRRTTPVVFGVTRVCLVALTAQAVGAACWVWFCVSYPLPVWILIAGDAVLAGWLTQLAGLIRRLDAEFDKDTAKYTHVGSIYVFGALNVITILGVLLG